MKILDKVQPKLVVGENIAQTAQFVESGNAQMGLISLTLASSPKFKAEGDYVLFPKVLSGDQTVCGGDEGLEEPSGGKGFCRVGAIVEGAAEPAQFWS